MSKNTVIYKQTLRLRFESIAILCQWSEDMKKDPVKHIGNTLWNFCAWNHETDLRRDCKQVFRKLLLTATICFGVLRDIHVICAIFNCLGKMKPKSCFHLLWF